MQLSDLDLGHEPETVICRAESERLKYLRREATYLSEKYVHREITAEKRVGTSKCWQTGLDSSPGSLDSVSARASLRIFEGDFVVDGQVRIAFIAQRHVRLPAV